MAVVQASQSAQNQKSGLILNPFKLNIIENYLLKKDLMILWVV
jgi:hypothetical protein